LTSRQIRRLVERLREHGAQGLVSRRRSKPSNNRLDAVTADRGHVRSFASVMLVWQWQTGNAQNLFAACPFALSAPHHSQPAAHLRSTKAVCAGWGRTDTGCGRTTCVSAPKTERRRHWDNAKATGYEEKALAKRTALSNKHSCHASKAHLSLDV